MTTDPKFTAALAQIDQFKAESEHGLDKAIEGYRAVRDDQDDEMPAFMGLVATVHDLIDPDDQLPAAISDRLTKVAEVLACAVSRLAKADGR